MKTNSPILLICTIACFFFFGCTPRNQHNDSDLIHINVGRSFPVKEINLADIARIEFVQLETHDDFLFRGNPHLITENKIIFGDWEGDILVFSRDGTPYSRFNRRGGGPEEFDQMRTVMFNEESNEIFVVAVNRIMVYSLNGEFRRAIPLLEGASLFDAVIVSFNAELFLIYDGNDVYPAPFSLISKYDGSVVETIDVPIGEPLEDRISMTQGERNLIFVPWRSRIILHNDGFLLNNYSTDTLFLLSPNKELTPFLVRTPELHANPAITIDGFIEAGDYQIIHTTRYQIQDMRIPEFYLMRNRTTGSVYTQRFIFDEFRGKEVTLSFHTIRPTQNSRIGLVSLDLTELQDANDEGRLSGRLQEIVESSYEFGNNVFMLLHFK